MWENGSALVTAVFPGGGKGRDAAMDRVRYVTVDVADVKLVAYEWTLAGIAVLNRFIGH